LTNKTDITPLGPDEFELVGGWIAVGNRIEADATCLRIDTLLSTQLRQIGVDTTGWEQLYIDPRDGRLWERTLPQSDLHGGGPPSLRVIEPAAAKEKYKSLSTEGTLC
jgi:hypothetical protein